MPSAPCCSPAARKRGCVARWKLSRTNSDLNCSGGLRPPGTMHRSQSGVTKMKIDVLTLFPAMFAGPLDESIIMRARKKGLLDLKVHDLRQWTHDRHKTVDDRPFGGGPGMLMKPGPIFEAVESLRREQTKVILLSPGGRKFDQAIARELAQQKDMLLVTGHYEGFDERLRRSLANDELSIGDYVLTN